MDVVITTYACNSYLKRDSTKSQIIWKTYLFQIPRK